MSDRQASLPLISSAADSRARISALRAAVRALTASVVGSGTSSIASSLSALPVGFSSRTSLGFCRDVAALVADPLRESAESIEGSASVRGLSSAICAMPLQDSLRLIRAATWPSSFMGWRTSGMWGPGGCWTLNTSEWPSDGTGSLCSLHEILEPHVPEKYWLSPKACRGILRRAEKRGKELPVSLRQALQARAGVSQE